MPDRLTLHQPNGNQVSLEQVQTFKEAFDAEPKLLGEGAFTIAKSMCGRAILTSNDHTIDDQEGSVSEFVADRCKANYLLKAVSDFTYLVKPIALTASYTDHGHVYAADTLSGENLKEILRRGDQAGHATVSLQHLLQIGWGVQELHRHGLVHRDLKPANCLMEQHHDGDRTVKLCDFGFITQRDLYQASKHREELARDITHDIASNTNLMSAGHIRSDALCEAITDSLNPRTLKGTPGYISPAMIRTGNVAYSFSEDIYSYGATMLELLTQKSFIPKAPDRVSNALVDSLDAHNGRMDFLAANPAETKPHTMALSTWTQMVELMTEMLSESDKKLYQREQDISVYLDRLESIIA